ncbi:hypothetical protein [Halomonas ramblicola]|uniref:hypothetical protein n=1 Tax=Halomonas ramblicola TaxID=747349 RepID=UPI0025B5F6C0|nr:hypothetical protein [Halomonas ramblicola]MDN3521517.1 hypothetical protein [Halomonas ramblicola]
MKTSSARPLRGPQVAPTIARRRELFEILERQAEQGDTHAVGWLLLLSDRRLPTPIIAADQ